MQRKYVDNFQPTHAAIAARVLQSPTAAYGPKEMLAAAASGALDIRSHWSFMSLRFERAGTRCEVDISVESVGRFGDVEKDPEGNEWGVFNLRFRVSYPSPGGSEPAQALAQVKLIADVAMLAAELQAEWPADRYIWKMTRTLAEIKEAEHKAAVEKQDHLARGLVERDGMKLRLGKDVWTNDLPAGIEPGTRYVEVWPKGRSAKEQRKFTVTVSDPVRSAYIQRTL